MKPILKKGQLYLELVKFEHTLFALPFALSAMVLASGNGWPLPQRVLWVLLAMVGGRTYAMGLNRIIDNTIDAANPRTKNRPLPSGQVKLFEAWVLMLSALGLLVYATFQLPVLCRMLLPVAIAILTIYSYVKRFSPFAHMVLGLALGSSAIGGWIAVTGQLTWPAFLFGLAVLTWVAGFDIIYATLDVDFDRDYGLFSVPARWGIPSALRGSRVLHGLTVGLLVAVGLLVPGTGMFYWLAVAITAAMLVYEHRLVSPEDLSRVNEAFFMVNGAISVTVFFLILADRFFQIASMR